MEKTTVLTKLDFKTLKYCNLFIMKYKRKTALWFLITAIISLGIIVWDVFFSEQEGYIFSVLGGFFILYSGYTYFNLEKRLDTQLARFFYNRKVTEQTVTVTDEKVIVVRSVDPSNPVEFDWSFITEIMQMPQYYMLMVGKGSPIILDRSSEALIEGSHEQLDAIIKDKASMKPYKVVDFDIVKIPVTYVHQEFPEVVSEEVVEEIAITTDEVKETEQEVVSEETETVVEAEESKEE